MKFEMTAGGRTLHFVFDVSTWFAIEESFGSIDEMIKQMDGSAQPARAAAKLIAACANTGAQIDGVEGRIDENWVAANMGCKAFKRANELARRAFIAGMRREEPGEESEDVDVVAEEIKKNGDRSAP